MIFWVYTAIQVDLQDFPAPYLYRGSLGTWNLTGRELCGVCSSLLRLLLDVSAVDVVVVAADAAVALFDSAWKSG